MTSIRSHDFRKSKKYWLNWTLFMKHKLTYNLNIVVLSLVKIYLGENKQDTYSCSHRLNLWAGQVYENVFNTLFNLLIWVSLSKGRIQFFSTSLANERTNGRPSVGEEYRFTFNFFRRQNVVILSLLKYFSFSICPIFYVCLCWSISLYLSYLLRLSKVLLSLYLSYLLRLSLLKYLSLYLSYLLSLSLLNSISLSLFVLSSKSVFD